MGCCDGIAKFVLGVFNLALLLIGLVPLVFGIIAVASKDTLIRVIQYIPGTDNITKIVDLNELIKSSAIFLIILGAILVLIGVLGFCGACCNVKCMIYLYLILLIAILLAEIAIIILAVQFPDTFSRSAKDLMLKSLRDNKFRDFTFDNTSGFTPPSDVLSLGWHTLQYELKCCGANNVTDYNSSTSSVDWVPRIGTALAPITCCLHTDAKYPPTSTSFDRQCVTPGGASTLYAAQGCFDALFNEIVRSRVAIGVMAGILALEVILIVLSGVRINGMRGSKEE